MHLDQAMRQSTKLRSMDGGKPLERLRGSTERSWMASAHRCVLSPILYTLYTHDCVASNGDNTILKFADDTAVVGRITGGDEAAYRREVAGVVSWCEDNNLTLNTDKTKEMIVDTRKERRPHQLLFIWESEVERVSSFRYQGVYITEDLTWTLNTTQLVKKCQQRLYFLRKFVMCKASLLETLRPIATVTPAGRFGYQHMFWRKPNSYRNKL
ncbi:uncharacterized protein LOC112842635 [Oreochromis niloticus]|uniref:uncharacterized protein LOC112842635 n=1 Tax=Oreochromis niloticus TaxID=8128 RepID=UPI000DF469CF|nr:uncharacterized protein LOC112842635 [Oreochromis niloticus]